MLPRLGVNGVVIRNGEILVIEFRDASGVHFNLPGGGVEEGESLHNALRRELREEACADVEVGRLFQVWEYFPEKHAGKFGTKHKVHVVFACTLANGCEPRLPKHPDPNQVAVKWIPLRELQSQPLLPSIGADLLAAIAAPDGAGARFTDDLG